MWVLRKLRHNYHNESKINRNIWYGYDRILEKYIGKGWFNEANEYETYNDAYKTSLIVNIHERDGSYRPVYRLEKTHYNKINSLRKYSKKVLR